MEQRRIAVMMHKGGCAKTTVAAQLAWGLSRNGRRVCVLDLDCQTANVSSVLGARQEDLPYSNQTFLFEPAVAFQPHRVTDNLHVIPANLRCAGVDLELMNRMTTMGAAVDVLKAVTRLRGDYEYIIMDTPPSMGIVQVNALIACTEVLAPVEMERMSVQGVRDLMSMLAHAAANPLVGERPVTFLPTFWEEARKEQAQALDIARELCGTKMAPIRIPRAGAVARANADCRPIWESAYNDSPKAQLAFANLVDFILSTER